MNRRQQATLRSARVQQLRRLIVSGCACAVQKIYRHDVEVESSMSARTFGFCIVFRDFPAATCLLVLGFSLLQSRTADAMETTTVDVAAIEGDGWSVRDLELEVPLEPSGNRPRGARLRAAVMNIAGMPEPLRNIAIDCPQFDLEARRITCARATVDAVLPTLGRQRFRAALSYVFASGALELAVEGLQVGGGEARVRGSLRDQSWTGAVILRAVRLETLLDLARQWSVPLPGLTTSGIVSLEATAQGKGTTPAIVEFKSAFSELTAANAAGTLASDKLKLAIDGRVERNQSQWRL